MLLLQVERPVGFEVAARAQRRRGERRRGERLRSGEVIALAEGSAGEPGVAPPPLDPCLCRGDTWSSRGDSSLETTGSRRGRKKRPSRPCASTIRRGERRPDPARALLKAEELQS